uniref:Uncharacterized protein n=1 Tax=Lepeophtheirus salmonis TaxID=72036 RepID=A0A0K2UM65_LEPSM
MRKQVTICKICIIYKTVDLHSNCDANNVAWSVLLVALSFYLYKLSLNNKVCINSQDGEEN